MIDNRVRNLKRSQKESQLRKEISKLFLAVKQDDKNFDDLFINKVQLSSDKSVVYVLFFSHKGEDYFDEKLPLLILYKPSMRKALAQLIKSRYTPQLKFKYDKTFEKQCKIEELLDKIKEEDKL